MSESTQARLILHVVFCLDGCHAVVENLREHRKLLLMRPEDWALCPQGRALLAETRT